MIYLRTLINFLPKGKALHRILAIALGVFVVIGLLCFVLFVVVPDVKAMDEQVAVLMAAKQDLMAAEEERETYLEQLQIRIAKVQDELEELYGIFMSKAQAIATLDRLYLYASQVGVEINNLQNLPAPKQDGQLQYSVEGFRIVARGRLPDLMAFIGRIEESVVYRALLLTNVHLVADGAEHVLTMDVTMYISPRATGEPISGLLSSGPAVVEQSTPVTAATLTGSVSSSGAEAAPTAHPYLVRPADWPADWPWPPKVEVEGTPEPS